MMDRETERRIAALESDLRFLREQTAKVHSIQNPFWWGIVIADVLPADDPLESFSQGFAELLVPNKGAVSGSGILKPSGKALPFINRWEELSLQRGTLCLFARDWTKSAVVTPGCDPSYEELLTLDENGDPLPGSSS